MFPAGERIKTLNNSEMKEYKERRGDCHTEGDERRGETGGGKTCSKSCKMREDDEREARKDRTVI